MTKQKIFIGMLGFLFTVHFLAETYTHMPYVLEKEFVNIYHGRTVSLDDLDYRIWNNCSYK